MLIRPDAVLRARSYPRRNNNSYRYRIRRGGRQSRPAHGGGEGWGGRGKGGMQLACPLKARRGGCPGRRPAGQLACTACGGGRRSTHQDGHQDDKHVQAASVEVRPAASSRGDCAAAGHGVGALEGAGGAEGWGGLLWACVRVREACMHVTSGCKAAGRDDRAWQAG